MVYTLSGGDYEKSALLHVSLGYTYLFHITNDNCVVDYALSLNTTQR